MNAKINNRKDRGHKETRMYAIRGSRRAHRLHKSEGRAGSGKDRAGEERTKYTGIGRAKQTG